MTILDDDLDSALDLADDLELAFEAVLEADLEADPGVNLDPTDEDPAGSLRSS